MRHRPVARWCRLRRERRGSVSPEQISRGFPCRFRRFMNRSGSLMPSKSSSLDLTPVLMAWTGRENAYDTSATTDYWPLYKPRQIFSLWVTSRRSDWGASVRRRTIRARVYVHTSAPQTSHGVVWTYGT